MVIGARHCSVTCGFILVSLGGPSLHHHFKDDELDMKQLGRVAHRAMIHVLKGQYSEPGPFSFHHKTNWGGEVKPTHVVYGQDRFCALGKGGSRMYS